MGIRASLVAQLVRNLPAVQETQVWSLGREDPLEKGVATHSGTLAWRIPSTEEPGRLQSLGSQRVGHNCATNFHFQFSSVQSLSRVWLFATPWTGMPGFPVHHQLPEFSQTHVRWVSDAINHLILCHPLLLLPSIFPSIRVFSSESVLHIRWPKYQRCSFSISPSSEHPGLISFRMTGWISLQSKGLSRVLSNTIVQKYQFFSAQFSL